MSLIIWRAEIVAKRAVTGAAANATVPAGYSFCHRSELDETRITHEASTSCVSLWTVSRLWYPLEQKIRSRCQPCKTKIGHSNLHQTWSKSPPLNVIIWNEHIDFHLRPSGHYGSRDCRRYQEPNNHVAIDAMCDHSPLLDTQSYHWLRYRSLTIGDSPCELPG